MLYNSIEYFLFLSVLLVVYWKAPQRARNPILIVASLVFYAYWSIAFLLPTMYISMHGLFEKLFGLPVPQIVGAVFDGPENAIIFAFSQFLLVLPIMYLNRRYYIAGFRNLFRGAPNMDSLVGMGSMAAALFGAFAIFPAELVFTIPHFARSTAVLAHLHELSTEQLEDLLDIAWRSKQR